LLLEVLAVFTWRVQRFDPDFVVVNGGVIDGLQKNKGYELPLIHPADQSQAGIATLMRLKARVRPECRWYFTEGTPYHVGVWGNRENEVARTLGAGKYSSVRVGRLCRKVLWLGIEGLIIEPAHHISVPTGFYRLTPLDREGQWSAMSAKDATQGIPKSDLLIRSHVHFFAYGEHVSKQILTTPRW
jgi:hypothetical protein